METILAHVATLPLDRCRILLVDDERTLGNVCHVPSAGGYAKLGAGVEEMVSQHAGHTAILCTALHIQETGNIYVNVEPVTLCGKHVRLEPLTRAHTDALAVAGLHPELWTWIPTPVTTPLKMSEYVDTALDEQARGVSLPFVIVDAETNEVIGCTRYGNVERAHKRVEIGWTWVTPRRQRTPVNSEAKLLLLTHAFETLGTNRVELKTDALNTKSRNAIGRIGAVQEGIFRQHMITASGRVRDTVYFSIIKAEWPDVKRRLQERLAYI